MQKYGVCAELPAEVLEDEELALKAVGYMWESLRRKVDTDSVKLTLIAGEIDDELVEILV